MPFTLSDHHQFNSGELKADQYQGEVPWGGSVALTKGHKLVLAFAGLSTSNQYKVPLRL
jgi:hypothetical protein